MFYRKHWKKSLIVVLSVLVVGGALGELTRRVVLAAAVGTKLHVAALGVNFENVGGPKRLAHAFVSVEDELGNRIDGALVEGNWSGCFRYADSATTQTVTYSDGTVVQGIADIEANKAYSCWGQPVKCFFTFSVTNISKAGMTYDLNANVTSSGSGQCR